MSAADMKSKVLIIVSGLTPAITITILGWLEHPSGLSNFETCLSILSITIAVIVFAVMGNSAGPRLRNLLQAAIGLLVFLLFIGWNARRFSGFIPLCGCQIALGFSLMAFYHHRRNPTRSSHEA